jgi:hypothetical protein
MAITWASDLKVLQEIFNNLKSLTAFIKMEYLRQKEIVRVHRSAGFKL